MFFTTIPETDRLIEITERKKIAINYLTGWFTIDFCSIIPFDMFMKSAAVGHMSICETAECMPQQSDNASNANIMLRAPKITKAFRAVRLLRMVKVFKLMKKRQHLSKHFHPVLKLNAGKERLGMLIVAVFYV